MQLQKQDITPEGIVSAGRTLYRVQRGLGDLIGYPSKFLSALAIQAVNPIGGLSIFGEPFGEIALRPIYAGSKASLQTAPRNFSANPADGKPESSGTRKASARVKRSFVILWRKPIVKNGHIPAARERS